jgi:hypothetical protein
MTIDFSQAGPEYELKLAGSWDSLDGVNLKKALSAVPPDTRKLGIEATGLDSLPMAGVQVILAYIRYARSIPKPVHVYFRKDLAANLALWGLDHSGWENFFHGR